MVKQQEQPMDQQISQQAPLPQEPCQHTEIHCSHLLWTSVIGGSPLGGRTPFLALPVPVKERLSPQVEGGCWLSTEFVARRLPSVPLVKDHRQKLATATRCPVIRLGDAPSKPSSGGLVAEWMHLRSPMLAIPQTI